MSLPRFTMPFEPMTIEHLGLRLYSTLPPVIAELVSNAYDAESPKVEVVIPTDEITPKSEVIVRDFGHGMNTSEVQKEYLPIGRNRRGESSKAVMSKNGKVRVTGRKGLGKLSSFGVADEMEIRTVKKGQAVTLRLRYSDMRAWGKKKPGKSYEPTVIAGRTGATKDSDGVEVTLRRLRRTRRINPDGLRKGLARRLVVIGPKFKVLINGVAVQPGDRMQREDCKASQFWDVKDVPAGPEVSNGHKLSGWIGFADRASQVNRGVDIFASNKAVELGSYFSYASTHAQFARAHLVGEVHADFLDGDEDLIGTARNQVVWESPLAQALQEWGRDTLKWAFDQWVELRREAKSEIIIREAGFDKWLEGREPREQKAARRMIKLLADDENLDPASARPLLEIVKSSVETVAFLDLLGAIEAESANVPTLLRLFAEWRVIEAREHLKLADGRRAGLDKLEAFIDEGALEVQELQPLLVKNLWLINHSWTEADVQPTYTKLLRKNCKEPLDLGESERRLDILGVTAGGGLEVVELKRPEKTLSRKDLNQIEDYVDWARTNLQGTGQHAPTYIHGLLVVGQLSASGSVQRKVERLAGSDIRVETYRDIYERSRAYYREIEKRLEEIAPEYVKARRKVLGTQVTMSTKRTKKPTKRKAVKKKPMRKVAKTTKRKAVKRKPARKTTKVTKRKGGRGRSG